MTENYSDSSNSYFLAMAQSAQRKLSDIFLPLRALRHGENINTIGQSQNSRHV